MTDVEIILGVINARISHHNSCAGTPCSEEDWVSERYLCKVRERVLSRLVKDIRMALCPVPTGENDTSDTADGRWTLITEMGGDKMATLFNKEADACAAQDYFCRTYRLQ